MTVSRLDADGLATELTRLYGELEQQLAAGVARRLRSGIDSPDWLDQKLAGAGELRRWSEGLVARLAKSSTPAAARAVTAAFNRGATAAQRELAGRRPKTARAAVRSAIPNAPAIDRLASSLAGRLDATGPRVVRSVLDAYRTTVSAGSANVLGGALTRRDAASKVWAGLLDQGLTGFTDVRGRNWSLAGYVDMATRTTTAQAAVAGQLDRQAELGLDLVIVSDAPQECERCRPWEGKVLTRGGADGARDVQAEHGLTDDMVTVHVAGSVAQAIAAGLLHPNCRHSISSYLPGVTKTPTNTEDPEGDRARQRLRALEREVRAAKLQETGALTPEAKLQAQRRAAAAQGKIREHVKATKHLGIKRLPAREQLDLGNKRASDVAPAAPAPATRVIPSEPVGITRGAPAAERGGIQADLDSGVKRSTQLGGGAMGRVDLLDMNNGSKLVKKVTRDSAGRPSIEQQDAEELGAMVARAAGGRAPRVLRQDRDTVHMDFVPGDVYDDLTETEQLALEAHDSARRLALSDALMGNVDRNPGNLIRGHDGSVTGIDHGGAFDWDAGLNPPGGPLNAHNTLADLIMDNAGKIKPGAITKAEAAEIRAALAELEGEFTARRRGAWYRKMMTRLKLIEKSAK